MGSSLPLFCPRGSGGASGAGFVTPKSFKLLWYPPQFCSCFDGRYCCAVPCTSCNPWWNLASVVMNGTQVAEVDAVVCFVLVGMQTYASLCECVWGFWHSLIWLSVPCPWLPWARTVDGCGVHIGSGDPTTSSVSLIMSAAFTTLRMSDCPRSSSGRALPLGAASVTKLFGFPLLLLLLSLVGPPQSGCWCSWCSRCADLLRSETFEASLRWDWR